MTKKKHPGNDENDAFMQRMELMAMMYSLDVTPEEYSEFYSRFSQVYGMVSEIMENNSDEAIGSDDIKSLPRFFNNTVKAKNILPDADKKTLILKIQLKDVSKPPMWREISVPANFNFAQLHHAIQAVTGLEDEHLWQFQKEAYRPELCIGLPQSDDDELGLDEYTHDATETPLTSFLAEKGDKLVYVYDFGDDWIFDVKVLSIEDKVSEGAEYRKHKGELQPIEDTGGIWAYLNFREILQHEKDLTKKQKNEISEQYCFETFTDFRNWLLEHLIDPESIAEQLADI